MNLALDFGGLCRLDGGNRHRVNKNNGLFILRSVNKEQIKFNLQALKGTPVAGVNVFPSSVFQLNVGCSKLLLSHLFF